jgi:hypothetical protein
MMTDRSDTADYIWLTGDEAQAVLTEVAAHDMPLHATVARLRIKLSPARTHLAIEQVELRRRAATKFAHPDQMFFTRLGLEQATDQWVAAYKAWRVGEFLRNSHPRLGEARLLADLCCGIGGDLISLAERAGSSSTPVAIGLDLNPIAAHFAAVNSGATVQVADVARFDVRSVIAWHIDPDRRATGRRTTTLEYCQPDLNVIDRLLSQNPNAAIKLAPATKVPNDWTTTCELEWISRDRECRQLVAWHGNLALTPGLHRATILPPTRECQRSECATPPRTLTGPPNQPNPITSKPDQFIFDTDPAVRTARLTGTIAAEHNLAALSSGPTYLTGPRAISDPSLTCFQVDDVLQIRVRALADYLHQRNIGMLEIKTRGVGIDPEKLRRDLKLHGNNAATLLITNLAGRPTAILAQRIGT